MPPAVKTDPKETRDVKQPPKSGDKRSDLICRVKFGNTLPDIPFDPKFLSYPFELNRFTKYQPTSLEKNYKYDLLAEHDLGVPIDLINLDVYNIPPNALLDPTDDKLLEEEMADHRDKKRSIQHNTPVSWLRKTEYISSEYNRTTPKSDKAESRIGAGSKKKLKEEDFYKDRESQIRAIEKTFEDAKRPIERHFSKPNVFAVDVLPVFPDFDLWRHHCAQVIFDDDPGTKSGPGSAATATEDMSQAIIRGMVDESGEQFVAYFLPTENTRNKRKRDLEVGVDFDPADEYDYKLAREYNWNVKNKATHGYEENYFVIFKDDQVSFNELETRVRLTKRRLKKGAAMSNSRLIVQYRPLIASELEQQERRLLQLENIEDEEEAGHAEREKKDEEEGIKPDEDEHAVEPATAEEPDEVESAADSESAKSAESSAAESESEREDAITENIFGESDSD